MGHVAALPVRRLDLGGTKVTAEGLRALAAMRSLSELVLSEAYQLAGTGKGTDAAPKGFERARVRPLSAEELLASIRLATGTTVVSTDATPEYFMANKDQRTIVDAGYQIGGAFLKNKLWIFSSYVPSVDTTRRVI